MEATGYSIRLHEGLWGIAGQHQEQRRSIDAWEDMLEETLGQLEVSPTGRVQVATTTLWDTLGIEVGRRDRMGAMRISEIMQRLGFERTRVRIDGRVQVGYVRASPLGDGPRIADLARIKTEF
jgi:hypothetical protein